jgi:hypothetical protein
MPQMSAREKAFRYVSEIGFGALIIMMWQMVFIVLWGYF